jgi:hypothetical protein
MRTFTRVSDSAEIKLFTLASSENVEISRASGCPGHSGNLDDAKPEWGGGKCPTNYFCTAEVYLATEMKRSK